MSRFWQSINGGKYFSMLQWTSLQTREGHFHFGFKRVIDRKRCWCTNLRACVWGSDCVRVCVCVSACVCMCAREHEFAGEGERSNIIYHEMRKRTHWKCAFQFLKGWQQICFDVKLEIQKRLSWNRKSDAFFLALFLILFVATRNCDQCFKPVLRGKVLNLDSLKD